MVVTLGKCVFKDIAPHQMKDTINATLYANYNGTEYYYLRNGQGDIVGLLDQSGTKVVSYRYGSWGELSAVEGTLASTLGVDNPLRYRGYYYDVETGFFYLNSRYYDPETGRFINADDAEMLNGDGILSQNLYAYAQNNPINNINTNNIIIIFFLNVSIASNQYYLPHGRNTNHL